ncbi:telomere capping, CST complex subunit-domain-containing protein [Dactylonectria estremocensis]|uniref:Telomere capping, CST complex subunit-domain-containing protein n=1 Tax=Dactylonectria estremocensis TaxID=1079267 RepID=A0A9P9EX44_9HYPO|nr:telomere capping, CST complex subunit-domain-containing protein [Dactylonectria estremocensis]
MLPTTSSHDCCFCDTVKFAKAFESPRYRVANIAFARFTRWGSTLCEHTNCVKTHSGRELRSLKQLIFMCFHTQEAPRLHRLYRLPQGTRPVGDSHSPPERVATKKCHEARFPLAFICCQTSPLNLLEISVTSYSTALGCLSLGHVYPRGTDVTVLVDVNLILESLTSEKTRVGEYVNVIGYITSKQAPHVPDTPHQEAAQVLVQALMLWSTGPMDIQTYEKAFEAAKSSR